jgi:hypothetical protein
MNGFTVHKTSETNRLRTLCCFTLACDMLKIPINGNQMENAFPSRNASGNKKAVRSGKFNKLLRFDSIPSLSTIQDLDNKVKGVASLFHSPFWSTLYFLESKSQDINFQLTSLDLEILDHVFAPQRDSLGNFERKILNSTDIKNIFTIGTLSALSCLLLLRYEFNKHYCEVSKNYLDKLIVESFINVCVTGKLACLHWAIFRKIAVSLFEKSKTSYKNFPQDEVALSTRITKQINLLKYFIKIKPRMAKGESTLVVNLISLSDEKLLNKELTYMVKHHYLQKIEPKECKGLCWLIQKTNSASNRSEKIQLNYLNNKVKLISPYYH